MRSEILTLPTGAVRCWRGGAGRPLILLHGGMGDAELHWSGLWDRLAERYDVIAPDLPGFGRSAALKRPNWLALVQWLDSVRTALSLEDVILVGTDFGASLARAYGGAHHYRTRGLVMINGGFLPGLVEQVLARVRPGAGVTGGKPSVLFSRERLTQMVADPAILTDRFVAACQANNAIVTLARRCALGPAPDREVVAHALILWGEHDRIHTLEQGRRLATAAKGLAFRVLPGCGHLPAVEAPEATAAALLAFLD